MYCERYVPSTSGAPQGGFCYSAPARYTVYINVSAIVKCVDYCRNMPQGMVTHTS